MRKRPRAYPEIIITKASGSALFLPGEEYDRYSYEHNWDVAYKQNLPQAAHTTSISRRKEMISFINMKGATEEYILYTLLHETDHWAQTMYLDKEGVMDVIIGYNLLLKKISEIIQATADYPALPWIPKILIPFVEKINAFPSDGWTHREHEQKWIKEMRWRW
jgi:hypothetical protein